jgi:hypothetical protein
MDPGPRPTDEEMTAIVAQLRDAGLLTVGVDADGTETWTLMPHGAQVARQLAMGDDAASWTPSLRLRDQRRISERRRSHRWRA